MFFEKFLQLFLGQACATGVFPGLTAPAAFAALPRRHGPQRREFGAKPQALGGKGPAQVPPGGASALWVPSISVLSRVFLFPRETPAFEKNDG